MVSPPIAVFSLLALALVIIALAVKLISSAARPASRIGCADPLRAAPAEQTKEAAKPTAAALVPQTAKAAASTPMLVPNPANVLEMPVRASVAESEAAEMARNPAALEEQAFEAARQSLTRIAGQTQALMAMPDVRRHERVDMGVRAVAAESGWLLQALNGLLRIRGHELDRHAHERGAAQEQQHGQRGGVSSG